MKKITTWAFLSFLFLLLPIKVNAASFVISGKNNIAPGETTKLTLTTQTANINGLTGKLVFNGNGCVNLKSSTLKGNNLGYVNTEGGSPAGYAFAVLEVEAVSHSCQATINFENLKGSIQGGEKFLSSAAVTINVSAPLSTNNNLSSLTVSEGSLSPGFSTGTTDYKVNVGANVGSITINATKEDAKANVAGAGTKNLSYGSNKFSITVTAENGSKKVYNVNVIREDNRSSNATLKSLTVKNGTLSPGFSPSTTSYTMDVGFDVTKLDISAVASDEKAKVSISNPDLVAEGKTNVTVKVTAENGSSKSYTIAVTRGKDPNKVLNTDNTLTTLSPSIGILSPAFDPYKEDYYIYLPYEIDTIDFEYEVSDKTYGKVEFIGDKPLVPNFKNVFKIKVTAEDESVRTYTINVYRAKNPDGAGSDNIKIKDLKISGGKFVTKFTSDNFTYYYTGKDIDLDITLEDEDATYQVIKEDGDIYIIVEAPNGDVGVYCLHKQETDKLVIGLIITSAALALAVGCLLIDKFFFQKRKKRSLEK